jgi:hypothetical protein
LPFSTSQTGFISWRFASRCVSDDIGECVGPRKEAQSCVTASFDSALGAAWKVSSFCGLGAGGCGGATGAGVTAGGAGSTKSAAADVSDSATTSANATDWDMAIW